MMWKRLSSWLAEKIPCFFTSKTADVFCWVTSGNLHFGHATREVNLAPVTSPTKPNSSSSTFLACEDQGVFSWKIFPHTSNWKKICNMWQGRSTQLPILGWSSHLEWRILTVMGVQTLTIGLMTIPTRGNTGCLDRSTIWTSIKYWIIDSSSFIARFNVTYFSLVSTAANTTSMITCFNPTWM